MLVLLTIILNAYDCWNLTIVKYRCFFLMESNASLKMHNVDFKMEK